MSQLSLQLGVALRPVGYSNEKCCATHSTFYIDLFTHEDLAFFLNMDLMSRALADTLDKEMTLMLETMC